MTLFTMSSTKRQSGILPMLLRWWIATWARFQMHLEVRRQRQQLKELDQRLLRDIGIAREDAIKEADRPFWDVDGVQYSRSRALTCKRQRH